MPIKWHNLLWKMNVKVYLWWRIVKLSCEHSNALSNNTYTLHSTWANLACMHVQGWLECYQLCGLHKLIIYLQSWTTVWTITSIEHLVFYYHTIWFLWLLPGEYSSSGGRTLPDDNSDISHRPRNCRNTLEVKGRSYQHRCCFITVTNISWYKLLTTLQGTKLSLVRQYTSSIFIWCNNCCIIPCVFL